MIISTTEIRAVISNGTAKLHSNPTNPIYTVILESNVRYAESDSACTKLHLELSNQHKTLNLAHPSYITPLLLSHKYQICAPTWLADGKYSAAMLNGEPPS